MRKAKRKNPVGRSKSDDAFVAFPMKVPQSLKEKYDAMTKEVKDNIRKEMIDKLRTYKDDNN